MMLTMVCGKRSRRRRRKSSSRRGSTKAALAEEGEGTRAGEAVAFYMVMLSIDNFHASSGQKRKDFQQ